MTTAARTNARPRFAYSATVTTPSACAPGKASPSLVGGTK